MSGAWHQEHNDPIKYSSTKALNFRAFESFTNKQPANRPWYQGLSLALSTTVFLVYFCILREENDMDDQIGSSLYERIPGLEKKQLMVRIEYDKMHGNDTKLLEERLRVVEIENSENTAAADSAQS